MNLPYLTGLPAALRFFTRLPVPGEPEGGFDIDTMGPALPLVGALVGAIGALSMLLALALNLGGLIAGALAIAAMIAATGGLHDDGLADTADSLGGYYPARRLEIMKDSRIGSFGVLALILGLLLRVGSLEALSDVSPWNAAAGLIAAACASRIAGLHLLHALPAARAGGTSASAGRPGRRSLLLAGGAAILISAALVIPSLGVPALIIAILAASFATYGVQRLAARLYGGQTGDVAGAAINLAEIAFLLALTIFAPPF
ncbi:MAG: cobS [Xanthobacteraceae bacterium]|jgi:adenosylcobinamide-GDP ribazoletransferase|nr:cobS [Xanthobacteraceae bacterium]